MCQNEVVSLYLGTVLGANYNFSYANLPPKGLGYVPDSKIGVIGQGHVGAHVANSLLMQESPTSSTCATSMRRR